ncbi:hypothetical protein ND00_19640 [Clostridium sp. L74]|nr:hypothetical protein ND00_19640 [Clostridium sp. L74]
MLCAFEKSKSPGKFSVKPCKINRYMLFLKIRNGYFAMVEQ